jgi:hypothetical protein
MSELLGYFRILLPSQLDGRNVIFNGEIDGPVINRFEVLLRMIVIGRQAQEIVFNYLKNDHSGTVRKFVIDQIQSGEFIKEIEELIENVPSDRIKDSQRVRFERILGHARCPKDGGRVLETTMPNVVCMKCSTRYILAIQGGQFLSHFMLIEIPDVGHDHSDPRKKVNVGRI